MSNEQSFKQHKKESSQMIYDQVKQHSTERKELKGILSEFREALEDEIDKIKKSGMSSTLLSSGRPVESNGADFWYRFNVEYLPMLPADTPCKLIVGNEQFDVTVISFEENNVIVSSKKQLPDTIEKARLENGATVLMERLIKCIETNAEKENKAGEHMLPPEGGVYPSKRIFNYGDVALKKENTQKQNEAITSALSNDITYIWGPPGTGKTTVIGQIIDELYKHDRSVLVVSHTNTAVDCAIEKAFKTYSGKSSDDTICPILRLGTPSKKLDDKVMLDYQISILGEELYKQKAWLEGEQEKLKKRVKELLPLFAKNEWINKNELKQIEESLLKIASYKSRSNEKQRKIEKLYAEMQKEKDANPEYKNYLFLSKTVKAKRTEHEMLSKKTHVIETTLHDLNLKIQDAQDELKKHTVYLRLREQESDYMPVAFLKKKLTETNENINVLKKRISNLNAEQAAAQQTIDKYEKKNSLTKLFVRKGSFEQAQSILQEINEQHSKANEDLARQQNLNNEYNQQLEKLLVIQDQIKEVLPSKTKAYWENELKQLQINFSTNNDVLSDVVSQRDLLYKELSDLEYKQSQIKTSFDIISEYGRRIHKENEQLNTIQDSYSKEKKLCSTMLEKECSMCKPFFQPTTKENNELYTELSDVFFSTKHEIADVDMEAVKNEKENMDNQLKNISRQLGELNKKLEELEKQAIMNAKILGTTLAKSYLNETLRERKFDTVILDEASMASIPALWCASYLAESSIVIVGDFLQLPPIVMAETPVAKKWLGKDIFHHSKMQERALKSSNSLPVPDNFVMLNEQFRMESDIADIANICYGEYGGLQTNDGTENREKERKKFYEWYSGKKTEHNIHLIDTESLHAWVTGVPQGKSHSRLNCLSAIVDVDLAFKFIEKKLNDLDANAAKPVELANVLIVAPYKPHITRINRLIELEYRNRGFKGNLNYIRAGTIHSFQGSEADIVIFDLVVDEPHWKANLFMQDKEVNDELQKMFNVAITRAKFKLFIVGNFAYCQKRAKNNALSRLLDKLIKKDSLIKVDAKKMLPDIVFSRPSESVGVNVLGKHSICREDSFNECFMADIHSFKERLIIYSPFMTENRLSVLIPDFIDAVNAHKQIVVITKALSDRSKTEIARYEKCEKELRDIGVSIIHKKGMHEKIIIIDSEIVWIGSLNALSFSGTTGEIMQRHADKALAKEYEKLFDIEHIYGAIEKSYEQKCPICEGEMLIKESDEGGIFWQCINKDYSRNASQQYPIDGILRCKCGAPYKFSMKSEPRWICTNNPKHYQKMRESDLKLEKMVALIPTKTVSKEVVRYFTNKRKEREAEKKVASRKTANASTNKSGTVEYEQLSII